MKAKVLSRLGARVAAPPCRRRTSNGGAVSKVCVGTTPIPKEELYWFMARVAGQLVGGMVRGPGVMIDNVIVLWRESVNSASRGPAISMRSNPGNTRNPNRVGTKETH